MLHFCVELTLSAYGAVIAALTLCGDRLRCQALGRFVGCVLECEKCGEGRGRVPADHFGRTVCTMRLKREPHREDPAVVVLVIVSDGSLNSASYGEV